MNNTRRTSYPPEIAAVARVLLTRKYKPSIVAKMLGLSLRAVYYLETKDARTIEVSEVEGLIAKSIAESIDLSRVRGLQAAAAALREAADRLEAQARPPRA